MGFNGWAPPAGSRPPAPLPLPVSNRVALEWRAGEQGKPAIAADLTDASEVVRMIADRHFMLSGISAASAQSAVDDDGFVRITLPGSVVPEEIVLEPHSLASATLWNMSWESQRAPKWSARVRSAGADADKIIWAGLKETATNVPAVDTSAAYFRASTDLVPTWHVILDTSAVNRDIDTGISVREGDDRHRLTIEWLNPVTPSTLIRFFIGVDDLPDVLVHEEVVGFDFGSSTPLTPYIGVRIDAGTPSGQAIDVWGIVLSQLLGG